MLLAMLRGLTGFMRGSAIVVAASFSAFSGQASALAYVGEYDPEFVTDFSDKYWSGSVKFEVPAACIPGSGGIVQSTRWWQSNYCGGMKLISATVEIRDSDDELLDTLIFQTSYFTLFGQSVADSNLSHVLFGPDGLPDGINGAFFTPVYTDKVLADDADSGTAFWLTFKDFTPVLKWAYLKCEAEDDDCHAARFNQVRGDFEEVEEECRIEFGKSPTGDVEGAAQWTRFYVVPEPGSLALLLPALGALGFVRRRRDRTAPITPA